MTENRMPLSPQHTVLTLMLKIYSFSLGRISHRFLLWLLFVLFKKKCNTQKFCFCLLCRVFIASISAVVHSPIACVQLDEVQKPWSLTVLHGYRLSVSHPGPSAAAPLGGIKIVLCVAPLFAQSYTLQQDFVQ